MKKSRIITAVCVVVLILSTLCACEITFGEEPTTTTTTKLTTTTTTAKPTTTKPTTTTTKPTTTKPTTTRVTTTKPSTTVAATSTTTDVTSSVQTSVPMSESATFAVTFLSIEITENYYSVIQENTSEAIEETNSPQTGKIVIGAVCAALVMGIAALVVLIIKKK